MKLYVLSLGAGLLVGIVYSLLQVRSPRPATRRVRSAMCWGNYRVGIASTRPLARRNRKRVERYIIE